MPEKYTHTNKLINEKSPYLLQHAHNPVNWYPWGEEAFKESKRNNKPIFLSIGYATCHWCHTMESESFEDEEIAALMNDTFVNIKVDREELPEVDNLYMEFAQSMMAGAAGWPLNVIVTPDLKPFFAATYLPPRSEKGMMGLEELILRIGEAWRGEGREKIISQSNKILDVFSENLHAKGYEIPSAEVIENTIELLFKIADPVFGGMKGAPKFPIGYQTNFLLRYSYASGDTRAQFLAERTLDMMQRGGIYDHLGGGFHRYSVDEQWLTPHFEKMLYDNALLSHSYLEAWQITKNDLYHQICDETIRFTLRELASPEGGVFSAIDADSEGHEGHFYTWTYADVQKILGKEDAPLFCEFYGITKRGNFKGRNILNTPLRLEEFADQKRLDHERLDVLFANQREKLRKSREKREHPFKDDKVLSSWNGLILNAYAEAAAAFAFQPYRTSAVKLAEFIQNNLWKDGKLYRRWRDGDAHFQAGLDEYSFMIHGLITLFEIGEGTKWLDWALEMTDILANNFKEIDGAFYQTDGTEPHLILRKCQFADGAEPSGNAIHCDNLLRLYMITYNKDYLRQAEDILKAVKQSLDTYPLGYTYHVMNLNHYYDKKAPSIVIALNSNQQYKDELSHAIFSSYLPHKSVVWRSGEDEKLFSIVPFIKEMRAIDGQTTLYICEDRVCEKPLTKLSDMLQAIENY